MTKTDDTYLELDMSKSSRVSSVVHSFWELGNDRKCWIGHTE